jgi:hypothetical protein
LVRNGQVIPGDKFLQLIQVMKQKGVLPKDKKIHQDALLGGTEPVLQEANKINWEKRLDNLNPSKDDAMNFANGGVDFDSMEGANSNAEYERNDTKKNLVNLMQQVLSDREFFIMKKLFGIGCKPMTLEEVGNLCGLTRERVRIIREKSIRKLRDNANFLNQAKSLIAEGENRTKNKGLRGGIDNLKMQEGRLMMNGESFFVNPNAIEVFNRLAVMLMGDKKSIQQAKDAIYTIFTDTTKSSKIFKDADATAFAAFCIYGRDKSPLKMNPSANKYYQITSKMVSVGSDKSVERQKAQAMVDKKQEKGERLVGSIGADDNTDMMFVEALCKKYRYFYLRGNTIYMCTVNNNKQFTNQGREDWIRVKKTLNNAGYTTTTPKLTRIKVKGESILAAYVNVEKTANAINEAIEVHTAEEGDKAREYTTQADFPKTIKCKYCGKDAEFLFSVSDQSDKNDKKHIGTINKDGNWEETELQAFATYVCPHCYHSMSMNNMA